MRKRQNETIEAWFERARQHEIQLALEKLHDNNIDLVLEEMSKRLIAKLLHTCIETIKSNNKITYDSSKSVQSYKNNYLNKVKLVADHMNDVE